MQVLATLWVQNVDLGKNFRMVLALIVLLATNVLSKQELA
jgi:hypothetical protein